MRELEEGGSERLYLVIETKGGLFADDWRHAEGAKIACGKAHFEALAVTEQPAQYLGSTAME